MPWSKIEDVPANVRTHDEVPLTLAQANHWAEIFDAIKNDPEIDNPAAVAWSTWEKVYEKNDDGTAWVKTKDLREAGKYNLTETNGHTHTANIDTDGNGTSSTNEGHNHLISGWIVGSSDEHTHGIGAQLTSPIT